MNCNLVKKVTKKDVNGETRTYVNYFLVFDNGVRINVVARYLPTDNIKDKTKIEQLKRENVRNATRLNDFADLEK